MWTDNDTSIDFVNFAGVADTVAEVIVRADGQPISIGVSGAWGVGKSSMINLIRRSLENREDGEQFLFVEFNAWLYQGYDDVRASLLEIIAEALMAEAERQETGVDKAVELLKRVDWFRAIRLSAGTLTALALGFPPVGLIGEIFGHAKNASTGDVSGDQIEKIQGTAEKAISESAGLIRPKPQVTPPKAIHAVRECFESTLQELGVTLVVLIDDLDRCLPATTIATLEAIRVFLFLKHAAFVIAADNDMIKHAVRKHFEGVDDTHVINYFDKLIQVPIRVPPLGTQEVRAYLILLFVQESGLGEGMKERIRASVCEQLAKSWQGRRVDRAFMQTLGIEFSTALISRFDAADRLAPVMTSADGIRGNPRLIKRFLNALSIRMAIARSQGVDVDEAVLTKLLLFERCGNPRAYAGLAEAISSDESGAPRFLAEWEDKAASGEPLDLEAPWDEPFVQAWLAVPPRLSGLDLRGALYVSREHAPLILPEDSLSSEGAELMTALLEHPEMAADFRTRLESLQHSELSIILDRVLERSRQVTDWGVPDELEACLAIARADPIQGRRLAAFLSERPPAQLTPAIVPKLSNESWAAEVFEAWRNDQDTPGPVKRAIERQAQDGNVAV